MDPKNEISAACHNHIRPHDAHRSNAHPGLGGAIGLGLQTHGLLSATQMMQLGPPDLRGCNKGTYFSRGALPKRKGKRAPLGNLGWIVHLSRHMRRSGLLKRKDRLGTSNPTAALGPSQTPQIAKAPEGPKREDRRSSVPNAILPEKKKRIILSNGNWPRRLKPGAAEGFDLNSPLGLEGMGHGMGGFQFSLNKPGLALC